jgi:hypothetical protein
MMARKSKKPGRKKSSKTPKTKSRKTKTSSKKGSVKRKPRRNAPRGRATDGTLVAYGQRGLGARSGGQAGDTQGLPASPNVDAESVEELLEEGQSFEAEVLDGIENAPDPDEGGVKTREVPEDDVPDEYKEPEQD